MDQIILIPNKQHAKMFPLNSVFKFKNGQINQEIIS